MSAAVEIYKKLKKGRYATSKDNPYSDPQKNKEFMKIDPEVTATPTPEPRERSALGQFVAKVDRKKMKGRPDPEDIFPGIPND